jgi:hypothetical protein
METSVARKGYIYEFVSLIVHIFKSEFHFLPPKIDLVPLFTQFNKKFSKLPHLAYLFPFFTLFYILHS